MKRAFRIIATGLVLGGIWGATLSAQVYPLSSNSWDNPEFVNRFLGSYGVHTRLEPDINREEAQLFQQLPELIDTNPNQAIQRLRQAITPESSAALDYTLGSLLLQQGDSEAAIRYYESAIRKFPNFMRAYKNYGLVLVQLGKYAEAIPMLVKAIELGDGDGNTYGLLAFSYLNSDRPRAAVDAYRMAYILKPENRDWKIGKAQSLLQIGDNLSAAALLKELIESDPSQSSYWQSRANAMIAMGQETEAVAHLELVKRMGRANAATLRLLGDAYLNQQLPSLAVENYLGALRSRESIPERSAILTAQNLARFSAYQQAQTFIEAVMDAFGEDLTDQGEVSLLNITAEIHLAQGEDAAAAQTLEEVLKVDPLNGRALLLLGNFHAARGEVEEAAYNFTRAAAIPTVQVEALVQHARMLVGERDFRAAITLLERAQSIRPSNNVEIYLTAVRNAYEAMR